MKSDTEAGTEQVSCSKSCCGYAAAVAVLMASPDDEAADTFRNQGDVGEVHGLWDCCGPLLVASIKPSLW